MTARYPILACYKTPARRLRRRASVLILVVVLLVLLALMGTAYLTTVRADRYSARQHATNVETDLLLEGAKSMVLATVERDLYEQSGDTYRPGHYAPATSLWEPWDDPITDEWLASRVPEQLANVAPLHDPAREYFAGDIVAYDISGTTHYYQAPVYLPPGSPAPDGASTPWVELLDEVGDPIPPTWPVWPHVSVPAGINYFSDIATGRQTVSRRNLIPWRIQRGTEYFPAFRLATTAGMVNVVAGDADNDGIADSGVFEMPVGRLDGILYFGSVRVIDNAAALNLNTAWKPADDYELFTGPTAVAGAPPLLPGDLFPTNIDLQSALIGTVPDQQAQMGLLNQHRFNSGAWSRNAFLDDGTAIPVGQFRYSSPYESLWLQLGRRVWNPGAVSATDKYASLSIGESLALATRFCIVDPYVSRSTAETSLAQTLVDNSRNAPYNLADNDSVVNWFNQNFDYNAGGMPLRALLVARNGLSNQAPFFTESGVAPVGTTEPTPEVPTRANLNTSNFEQLWRAFYNVMAADTRVAPNAAVPPPADTSENPPMADAGLEGTAMFRSSVRRDDITLDNFQQLQLRSALAAVAAEDLRDPDNVVTDHTITLRAGGGSSTDYQVTVFGVERQVYITELVVDQAVGVYWAAVEVYNPLPYEGYTVTDRVGDPHSIRLKSLRFARIARPAMTATEITPTNAFLDDDVIAPGEYAVFVSDAGTLPATITVSGPMFELDGLDEAAENGEEFMILRTRTSTGVRQTAPVDENILMNNVPVDQVDMTGWTYDETLAQRYRYARASGPGHAWEFVYPGAYSVATGHAKDTVADPLADLTSLGVADAAGTSIPTFKIQVNSAGMPGPNPYQVTSTNYFPIGGFARNGDALQVPFIGSYVIRPVGTPTAVIEANSVTIDSFYAEDDNPANDEWEQVGRFCPISPIVEPFTSYDWAKDLFDHVTVQAPDRDFLPEALDTTYTLSGQEAVSNKGGVANANEADVPVEGLININTAPWYILARLPLVVDEEGRNLPWASTVVAKLIAADRTINGPFRSPFDLLRVGAFRDPSVLDPNDWAPAGGWVGSPPPPPPAIPIDPTPYFGDITPALFPAAPPALPFTDGVSEDFEYRYAQLIRISNLITTRSDSFTVYLTVEGWRDPGTSNATRITQRRAAFIIDRSTYTPLNRYMSTVNIPTE